MLQNISKSAKADVKIPMFLFVILTISSVAGQNLINFHGYKIASGMFIFPLTFPLVASLTELYGFRYARSIIWTGAIFNFIMAFVIFLFALIPSSNLFIGTYEAYHAFCKKLAFLMAASAFAYLISENVNAWIISKLGILMKGKYLIFRALISISAAAAIDSWIIFPFFLYRQKSLSFAVSETCIDIFVKIIFEIMLLPIFWIFVGFVKGSAGWIYRKELPDFARQFLSVFCLNVDSAIMDRNR